MAQEPYAAFLSSPPNWKKLYYESVSHKVVVLFVSVSLPVSGVATWSSTPTDRTNRTGHMTQDEPWIIFVSACVCAYVFCCCMFVCLLQRKITLCLFKLTLYPSRTGLNPAAFRQSRKPGCSSSTPARLLTFLMLCSPLLVTLCVVLLLADCPSRLPAELCLSLTPLGKTATKLSALCFRFVLNLFASRLLF